MIAVSEHDLIQQRDYHLEQIRWIDDILQNNKSGVSTSDSQKGNAKKPIPGNEIERVLSNRDKKFFKRK